MSTASPGPDQGPPGRAHGTVADGLRDPRPVHADTARGRPRYDGRPHPRSGDNVDASPSNIPTAAASRATVTVAGTGRASRPPDIAETTFVVEASRPTAADARASAATIAASVLDAVRRAGVADVDLHTAGLDVSP